MVAQDRSAGRDASPDVPLETFSKVVEAIYDCALNPHRWHDTVRSIAELLRSQRCTLGVHDYMNGCNDLMFQMGWDNDHYWKLHEEKYSRMSPFFMPLQMLPVGAVTTASGLVPEHEFVETRYYQEWVKPQGLSAEFVALKVLQTGQRAGLLVANRDEVRPRYDSGEIRLLSLLAPHICRAVTISDTLSLKTVRSEALEATLDALSAGVYLSDCCGRIVFMNRAAERQVRNGTALRIENNHLVPIDRVARGVMSNAIAEAIADESETPASGVTLAVPATNGVGLVATILPLSRGDRRDVCGAFEAFAAIFVQDPIVVPPFPGEAFAKLHGLTGSELRVLLAMAPGLGVKEAAEMLGIGETTAKTHLQHIYAKTRTSKQTELMHLFMSSAPPVKVA